MNTRSSPALRVELTVAGATYEVVPNRHYKVRWQLGAHKGTTTVSVSSGTFAPNHALRDIRRQLRGVSLG